MFYVDVNDTTSDSSNVDHDITMIILMIITITKTTIITSPTTLGKT